LAEEKVIDNNSRGICEWTYVDNSSSFQIGEFLTRVHYSIHSSFFSWFH